MTKHHGDLLILFYKTKKTSSYNKKPSTGEGVYGAENGTRTRNVRLGKPMLYH